MSPTKHPWLPACWAQCNGRDPQAAGIASAAANGFDNDGTTNTVTITDLGGGRFDAVSSSTIDGGFAKTVGAGTITASSQAVANCSISTGVGGFALFAGSTSCGPVDLSLTGSSQTIIGGIHSNDQLRINGNAASPSKIYGPVTAVVSVQHSGVLFFELPPPPAPEVPSNPALKSNRGRQRDRAVPSQLPNRRLRARGDSSGGSGRPILRLHN